MKQVLAAIHPGTNQPYLVEVAAERLFGGARSRTLRSPFAVGAIVRET
jgi:hypothetical protein